MDNDLQNKQIEIPTEEKIAEYKAIDSNYSDFGQFEDSDSKRRTESKRRFIENIDYVPQYRYPKLNTLKDKEVTIKKKTDVYNAVLELEVTRKAAEIIGDTSRTAELQLYRSFHDLRLKKIMLAEAAQYLHDTATSAIQETARESFMVLNKEVYGEMDEGLFNGMLSTEHKNVKKFQPTTDLAAEISGTLSGVLKSLELANIKESEILSEDNLQQLHEYVLVRYAPVLSEVPETDDDVYYNAEQCAEIINKTLAAGRLAERGWSCEINVSKSNPVTRASEKSILLPINTRRNSSELRRLIIHEQETHARRAQNGDDKGSKLLSSGTADYADVEEGLGVMLECAIEGDLANPSFKRARERYITAGLALGVDKGGPRDAREVYEILWRMIAVDLSTDGSMSESLVKKSKDKAFIHVENAFRGTDFWMKGVIYKKLKVYYEGLIKNGHYFADNIDNLDKAFDEAMIGKFNHTDSTELELVKETVSSAY